MLHFHSMTQCQWTPAKVEMTEVLQDVFPSYPKETIVSSVGSGIVAKRLSQKVSAAATRLCYFCPGACITWRKSTTPSDLAPRVFETKDTMIADVTAIQNWVRMAGDESCRDADSL
jgi:hypothetical protein